MANLSHVANDGRRGELRPMTKEQYARQNKDLQTRIENMKIARQISEGGHGLEIQELNQELRSKANQIRMLQSQIAKMEDAYMYNSGFVEGIVRAVYVHFYCTIHKEQSISSR